MGQLTTELSSQIRASTATASTVSAPGDRTAAALAGGATGQILDVLSGRRPLHQIRHRVSGPVAGLIAAMLRGRRTATSRYRLRTVHASLITACTVEASAVIADNKRVRALTMRLEQRETQWLCTVLALL